ncbi:hypothetical protein GQ53DRAFT_413152 [Thozetella sp. PMI_491]|nr:hypothetical protein GQ53DRAFT_413152 [Thozetella sp. PMI_491]
MAFFSYLDALLFGCCCFRVCAPNSGGDVVIMTVRRVPLVPLVPEERWLLGPFRTPIPARIYAPNCKHPKGRRRDETLSPPRDKVLDPRAWARRFPPKSFPNGPKGGGMTRRKRRKERRDGRMIAACFLASSGSRCVSRPATPGCQPQLGGTDSNSKMDPITLT